MSKYKIGDKVRVLHTDYPTVIEVGDVLEVSSLGDDGPFLMHSKYGELYFYDREVEPYIEPTSDRNTLALTATVDFAPIHAELDAIIAKLERIRELRAELGLVNSSTGA